MSIRHFININLYDCKLTAKNTDSSFYAAYFSNADYYYFTYSTHVWGIQNKGQLNSLLNKHNGEE